MDRAEENEGISPEWLAFSEDKQAWKAAGNYFTADEFRALEESARKELVLEFCPEPLLRAD